MQVVVESFDRPNLHYSAVHCRCATAEDEGASAAGQSLAPLRALLPVQVFDQCAEWMGVLDAMHDFKGGMTGTRAHTAVKN